MFRDYFELFVIKRFSDFLSINRVFENERITSCGRVNRIVITE